MVCIGCLIAAFVLIPPIFTEAIPFSMFPMYASNPRYINLVKISTSTGEDVHPAQFQLHLELHPWAPRYSGMPTKSTLNPTDRPLTTDEVSQIITAASHPDPGVTLKYSIKLRVVGPRNDGSFGDLELNDWTICIDGHRTAEAKADGQ